MLPKSLNSRNLIPFSNATWRNLLNEVCRKIDKEHLGLQVISPFGFELLEDKNFLYKSIKRLYCYIGIPSVNSHSSDPSEISTIFSKELMRSLPKIELDQSNIAILVIQDKFNLHHKNDYQCYHSDKLIDIQTKIINADILHDYSNYIICTVDSICSKKEEPKHFLENKRHRCRTYQLYIMLEHIFGYLLKPMSSFQKVRFYDLFKRIDNSIQMFYTPSELYIHASDDEVHLLNFLINPRVTLMQQAIKTAACQNELIKLQCDAYHVEGKLELIINKNIYKNAINKIKKTYLNFV